MEGDSDELREAVEKQHGGRASFVAAVPVRSECGGALPWVGVVYVYDLDGHPDAKRAYAWSYAGHGPLGLKHFVAVLHTGLVQSPSDAVRAGLAAERESLPKRNRRRHSPHRHRGKD